MDINTAITLVIVLIATLSALIFWSVGETRRHQHRQAMKRYVRATNEERQLAKDTDSADSNQ